MQYGGVNFGVILKADSPYKTFKDLIAYAHQNPKKLILGTGGTTSVGRLTVEQAAIKEGVQFTHIPFKRSPETEVLSQEATSTSWPVASAVLKSRQERQGFSSFFLGNDAPNILKFRS